jgi:hypothetical protein
MAAPHRDRHERHILENNHVGADAISHGRKIVDEPD